MKTSKELREKRQQVYDRMDEIVTGAGQKNGATVLSKSEKSEYDKLDKRFTEFSDTIEVTTKQETRKAELTAELGVNPATGEGGVPLNEVGKEYWFDKMTKRSINVIDSKNKLSVNEQRNEVGFGQICRAYLTGPLNDTESRALSEGTNSAGGFTVPDILSRNVIDRMRAKSTVVQAGMQTVSLDSDNLSMAKLLTGVQTSWKIENEAVSASDPTFGSVIWAPKTLIALVVASNELIQDSVNIEQALEMEFTRSMASEIDRVALLGSGSGQEPEGVTNYTDIGSVSMGTNGGALVNFDPVIDAIKVLKDANAPNPTAAIMANRTWQTIAKLKDQNDQPLNRPGAIADLPFLDTSKIAIDDTQGTASDASKIILGDFTQLYMGLRLNIKIVPLTERYSEKFQTGFLAVMRADFKAYNEEAFAQIIGIIP